MNYVMVLRKSVYCEHLGYLPPMTIITLPADSEPLARRWVELGYSESVTVLPGPDATWGEVISVTRVFNTDPTTAYTIINELPTEEAAADDE